MENWEFSKAKDIRLVDIVFQVHRWKKYFGKFTDIVALNDNYS